MIKQQTSVIFDAHFIFQLVLVVFHCTLGKLSLEAVMTVLEKLESQGERLRMYLCDYHNASLFFQCFHMCVSPHCF